MPRSSFAFHYSVSLHVAAVEDVFDPSRKQPEETSAVAHTERWHSAACISAGLAVSKGSDHALSYLGKAVGDERCSQLRNVGHSLDSVMKLVPLLLGGPDLEHGRMLEGEDAASGDGDGEVVGLADTHLARLMMVTGDAVVERSERLHDFVVIGKPLASVLMGWLVQRDNSSLGLLVRTLDFSHAAIRQLLRPARLEAYHNAARDPVLHRMESEVDILTIECVKLDD